MVYFSKPDPDESNSRELHYLFRKRIKESLIRLVEKIAVFLKKDYQVQIGYLSSLIIEKKFSPIIYYFYFSLLEFIIKKEQLKYSEYCENLCDLLPFKNIYSETIVINTLENKAWEKEYIENLMKNANRPSFVTQATDEQILESKVYIQKALEIINKANKDMFAEIHDHVSSIKIFAGDYDAFSGTSMKYFGNLFFKNCTIDADPVLYFFESLIHETSHLHLNILMAFDPLLINSKEHFYSPARDTIRPMKGILHGHFVVYRLVLMYLAAYSYRTLFNNRIDVAENLDFNVAIGKQPWNYSTRLEIFKFKFIQGDELIRQHAKLTPGGQELLDNMKDNFEKMIH